MKEFIVKKKIEINARPEEVWDALTNPEKTKKYFFNSEVQSAWTKGSSITFKGKFPFIIPFEMKGMIVEIDRNKLLQYTLQNSRSSSTSTVTDVLSYENGITTISITDDVGQGEGAEKRFKRSTTGWDRILKGLKELVESNG